MKVRGRSWRCLGSALLVAGLGACAPKPLPVDVVLEDTGTEERAPLGGNALAQRRDQLERAYRDLVHFRTTVTDLRLRRERAGSEQFERFVHGYLGLHLDPLLAGQWQSRHAELMGLDANLRLIKADLLIRMRETAYAQRVIEELAARFRGRWDILVAYPIGRQNTLERALELIGGDKWRG